MKNKTVFLLSIIALIAVFAPDLAMASLESSLYTFRARLTGVVLPVVSVIGVCIAGFSFFTGNENAKRHIGYALIGCVVGFGAQAIVDFFSSVVR